MTVEKIVEKWLKENGYSGLYNDNDECGCGIDDLMNCDCEVERCNAGYKIRLTEENTEKYRDVMDNFDLKIGDYFISKTKEDACQKNLKMK